MAKPEANRPLGRHRCSDNIKMVLKDMGWMCLDWVHVNQKRDEKRAFVNTVIHLRIPKRLGISLNNWKTVGFSRKFLLTKLIKERLIFVLTRLCLGRPRKSGFDSRGRN